MKLKLSVIILSLFTYNTLFAHHTKRTNTKKQNLKKTIYVTNESINEIIEKKEKKYDLPKNLLAAVIKRESDFRPAAVNQANGKETAVTSYGLGQITMQTAKAFCGIKNHHTLFNPRENIACTAKILRSQLNRYDGNVTYALAAYKAGTPCVCDGKTYTQQLGHRTRVCTVNGVRLSCNERGKLLDDTYIQAIKKYRRNFAKTT